MAVREGLSTMLQFITAWFRVPRTRVTGQAHDDIARAHRWDIEHGRFGRRIYRDPRFRDPRFAALRATAAAAEEQELADQQHPRYLTGVTHRSGGA
jgi:hypothetical protein